MELEVSICWFRRDLRLQDNTALFHALNSGFPVVPVFIFDRNILGKLSDKADRRVDFIHRRLQELNHQLKENGSSFYVLHNEPLTAFQNILKNFNVREVFTNHDYEPYSVKRDAIIGKYLSEKGIGFRTFKDQVIFEKSEVVKQDHSPYKVFTPYSGKWKEKYYSEQPENYPSEEFLKNLYNERCFSFPTLREIGFKKTDLRLPELQIGERELKNYDKTRNKPSLDATSHAGVYLRFGTISIRNLVELAKEKNEIFLNELIWREFFMMILFHFPEVEHNNFRKKFNRIQWRNNEREFLLWCRGETGYPIIDAGMRQLNITGYIPNRVRMLVASFLTKHLLIDWRWGEAYFAERLLDYELSSNNGNWQWVAGTGCDAAPYFRIFNPEEQMKKFDPEQKYIKSWIENFHEDYLPPIVEHSFARKRALDHFKKALSEF